MHADVTSSSSRKDLRGSVPASCEDLGIRHLFHLQVGQRDLVVSQIPKPYCAVERAAQEDVLVLSVKGDFGDPPRVSVVGPGKVLLGPGVPQSDHSVFTA